MNDDKTCIEEQAQQQQQQDEYPFSILIKNVY